MRIIKKSTATTIMVLMTSDVNHISGIDGLTLATYLSKNGVGFVNTSLDVEDVGYGWYNIVLSSGDTDTLGDLVLHIESDGADPSDVLMQVSTASTEEVCSMVRDMYTIQGLSATPSTVNKGTGKWIAGDIELDLSGDGINIQTMQRH